MVEFINKSFEEKVHCITPFLNISQAFGKLCHRGFLYKHNYYEVIKTGSSRKYREGVRSITQYGLVSRKGVF